MVYPPRIHLDGVAGVDEGLVHRLDHEAPAIDAFGRNDEVGLLFQSVKLVHRLLKLWIFHRVDDRLDIYLFIFIGDELV